MNELKAMKGISKEAACGDIARPPDANNEEAPKTPKILNILLPITLPTAISFSFFTAAMIEVAASGREVPAETKVKPMTLSLIPNELAI